LRGVVRPAFRDWPEWQQALGNARDDLRVVEELINHRYESRGIERRMTNVDYAPLVDIEIEIASDYPHAVGLR
jgi:hypothetical protein